MVEQWEQVLIGDCFDFKNGLNKAKKYFGKGTPIINYTDVYKKRRLLKDDIKGRVTLSSDEIRRFLVEKGDVFFTRTSETPEEVGYASVLLEDIEDCVFSGFVLKAHPKNNRFLPLYCKYCFMTPEVREAIIKSCTYTTRALTNGRQLSALKICLPPLSEQRRIAEALSDLDELIASLEKLIEKKKAIKQGAMQELLTGKRRLPGFSGEWTEYSVEDVAEFSTSTTPVGSIDVRHYIGTDNMLSNKGVVCDNTISIPYSVVRAYRKGDILISNIRPYLKKIWQADRTGGCSNDVLVVRVKDEETVLSAYLYYLLAQDAFFDELMANAVGTKMPRGDKTIIKKYHITMPCDLKEQASIVEALNDINDQISYLGRKCSKAVQIKQGMMQQLLTGKIRL